MRTPIKQNNDSNLISAFRAADRLVMICVLLFACISGAQGQAPQRPPQIVRITIVHLNDVYQFVPVASGSRGGLARVLTIRNQIATESPNVLFLFAGDTLSPSVESLTYKGAQMIDAWNAIGIDYAVFGNHEFDFGPDVLQQRMLESRFKWLGANVIDKRNKAPFAGTARYDIREFGGVKIGIMGLVLPDTQITSRPGPDLDFQDPCKTSLKLIPEMRARGAQLIVALTHLSMAEDKALARCAPVDVIIGGHEHTLLQSLAGRTPIFKVTADAVEVGRVDLNVDSQTGKLMSMDWSVIPVTDQVADDPKFASVMGKYEELIKKFAEAIGRTNTLLDGRTEATRTRETNLGSFIADAFRAAVAADVALVNGGSIRVDETIQPGVLTLRDITMMVPFNNPVIKIKVTGKMLRAALEHGVASVGKEHSPGRFPQVSGIRFTFDARRTPGARLVEVTINGQPLKDDATYTLATTSFVAQSGGDGYDMFRSAQVLSNQPLTDTEIVRKAISSVPSISPKVDGRIKRIDQ
jgi:5'-nucleotidase / UDP-sugar diphosphatase